MTGERATGVWLEEQLERALERIEALTRDVARAQASLAARERELDELRAAMATFEGRTRRAEASTEAVPDLRRALSGVEQRLDAESALRRDQIAASERERGREGDAGRSLERLVIDLDERIATLERAQAANADRDAHLAAAGAAHAQQQELLAAQVAALHAQVEALATGAHHGAHDLEQVREALDATQQHVAAVEARTETMQRDVQRFEDELLVVRRHLDRETALADLLEQQRVLRLRVEEGLATLGERAESQTLAARAEAEEHALLRAHLAGLDRALAGIAARVEAQREVLVEHFRRATDSAEVAGRRQTEEIDRQVRAARELLVRLTERTDEATREQPL